jgi:hypothetical protein
LGAATRPDHTARGLKRLTAGCRLTYTGSWRARASREELRCLAGEPFFCRSTTLRPWALRPQLKRDPLGAVASMELLNKQTSDLSPAEWAAVWLRYHRERRDEDFWAVAAVFLLPQEEPERAWSLILALVEQASFEELGHVGAGPLEHLVEAHAPSFIDRIESQAATDPKFKEALASIWLNSWHQDSRVVSRLVAASGNQIEPFELDHDQAERDELQGRDDA